MSEGELATKIAAVAESVRQMKARSGPIYEQARERGLRMHEEWRKAGSPAHISIEHGPNGPAYIRVSGHGRNSRREPATEEEWLKWRAWAERRDQLRRELNIWRGPSGKSRRDAPRSS